MIRRRHIAPVILAGVTSLLLAACASPIRTLQPQQASDSYWLGRLSLQTRSEPPQSFAAGFELSGQPARGELVLTSPIGNRLAEVHWSPGGAELLQSDKRQHYASLDELIARLTGTAIPVPALFDWLRGQHTAVAGWQVDLSRQADGRVTAVRQWPAPGAELRVVFQPSND